MVGIWISRNTPGVGPEKDGITRSSDAAELAEAIKLAQNKINKVMLNTPFMTGFGLDALGAG